jgi:hypothetical protein
LEELISHVVFSFTALEAFANEVIPENFTYTFAVVLGGLSLSR